MSTVPGWIESILEGLGARASFREAILGDLSEEFAIRAEKDGLSLARRWYYRESIRAVPHLVRDWCRHLRACDIRDFARVTIVSLLSVAALGVVLRLIAHALVLAGVASPEQFEPEAAWRSVGLLLAFTSAVIGGYVAARMYPKAPVVIAVGFGAVWACLNAAALLLAPETVHAPQAFGMAAGILGGTAAGGIVCACHRRVFA
jgi:hypothetical protein